MSAVLDLHDTAVWQGPPDAAAMAAAPLVAHCQQVGWTAKSDAQGNPRDQGRMVVDAVYRAAIDALRARAPDLRLVHYIVPVAGTPWQTQMAGIAAYTGPIPPGETSMFDLEYLQATTLGWPALMAWMDATEQRDQRDVFHYGELFDQDDRPDRPKWPAHYGKAADGPHGSDTQRAAMLRRYAGVQGLTVWQYTNALLVPYFAGGTIACDGNTILDRARFDAAFAITPPPPPSPPPGTVHLNLDVTWNAEAP